MTSSYSSPWIRRLSAPGILVLPLLSLSVLFLAPAGCKRDPSVVAGQHYARAQELLKQNKTEAAIIELNRAVQAKPDMAKAHHDLAKLYFDRGDFNDSFREYSLAVRYNPKDYDAYQILGEILLRAREFSKSKDIATQILSNWPDDRYGKSLLAESMMGLDDWDGARKLVEQNAKEAAQDARAQFDLATLFIHDKKWPEAESQLRLSWNLGPKVVVTPIYLAQLLESQGKFPAAEDALNRAIKEQPQRTEPLFALASLYIRQKRLLDAEQVFRKIQTVDPKNPRSVAALGEFYIATGNLKAAESEFRRLTTHNPQDSISWHHLADVEGALGQPEEARRIAGDLVKKDPKDWRSLVLLARLNIDEGKAAPAEQELAQAKAAQPHSALVQFQLARLYLLQGKTASAKSALGEALRRAPNYAPARILQGALELRAGQSDLAVQDLSAALKQAPSAFQPNLMISQAYAQRGDFNLAEDTLQRLLGQPSSPADQAMIFETLAGVQFKQQRYPEAIALAAKSLNTGFLSSEGLRILGLSYLAQKRPDQALSSMAAFTNKADRWAAGQDALGEVALQANRLDVAERAYQKELELQPNSSSALFGLGDTYDRGGQYAKAQDFFSRFAAAEPSNAVVHVRLGVLAERNADLTRATAEYQKAISLDSSNAIAKNNLAWIYAEHEGDLNVALRLAQEARSLLPDDPSVADTLGWILVKKNLGGSALPYLKECVKKSPGKAVYRYHLGLAYLQAGNKSLAKTELRAALQQEPSFAGSADAKKTLDTLAKSEN
jgi:tetratricopeptide (TPR) repeat protein